MLASASKDRSAIVWELGAGGLLRPLHTLAAHEQPVCYLAWSPDDSKLLTCRWACAQRAGAWGPGGARGRAQAQLALVPGGLLAAGLARPHSCKGWRGKRTCPPPFPPSSLPLPLSPPLPARTPSCGCGTWPAASCCAPSASTGTPSRAAAGCPTAAASCPRARTRPSSCLTRRATSCSAGGASTACRCAEARHRRRLPARSGAGAGAVPGARLRPLPAARPRCCSARHRAAQGSATGCAACRRTWRWSEAAAAWWWPAAATASCR
jgi:hypothetical protein